MKPQVNDAPILAKLAVEAELHDKNMQILIKLREQVFEALPQDLLNHVGVKTDEEKYEVQIVLLEADQLQSPDFKRIADSLDKYHAEYVNLKSPGKPYFLIPLQEQETTTPPVTKTGTVTEPTPSKKETTQTQKEAEVETEVEPVQSAPKISIGQLQAPTKLFIEEYCDKCANVDCPKLDVQIQTCVSIITLTNIRFLTKKIDETNTKLQHQQEHQLKSYLNKQTQTTTTTLEPTKTVEDIRMTFPEQLDAMLSFEDHTDYVTIKPKQYLGSENFAEVAKICKNNNGEYISAGRDSHFKIPKQHGKQQQPKQQDNPLKPQQVKRPEIREGSLNDNIEVGKTYQIEGLNAIGAKGNTSKYYRVKRNENQESPGYAELYDLLNREDQAARFGEGMFRWILNDGSGDIGIKHQKPKPQQRGGKA